VVSLKRMDSQVMILDKDDKWRAKCVCLNWANKTGYHIYDLYNFFTSSGKQYQTGNMPQFVLEWWLLCRKRMTTYSSRKFYARAKLWSKQGSWNLWSSLRKFSETISIYEYYQSKVMVNCITALNFLKRALNVRKSQIFVIMAPMF